MVSHDPSLAFVSSQVGDSGMTSSEIDGMLRVGDTLRLTEPELRPARFPQPSTDRFRIIEAVGHGGFGDVYRAWDSVRRTHVALKVLRAQSNDALDRFKREFRYLQDLTHPGLVPLHELMVVDGRWFFTMDYVHGSDFMRWVRSGIQVMEPDPDAAIVRRRRPACDMQRLWRGSRKLAETLRFIHEARYVHRDVKPNNVLVGEHERVMLLDFGLVKSGMSPQTHMFRTYGTPRYLAPEQARGRSGTAAADWYAFGTMLYEAIAGRAPFVGDAAWVVELKLRTEAPPLGLLVEEIDPDVDRFVTSLLARDPGRRPGGADILRFLEQRAPNASYGIVGRATPRPAPVDIVGREQELGQLHGLWGDGRRSGVSRLHVRGPSGIGKSALLEYFATQVADRGALVLRSRCFECESVPYKAFEGLIDELRTLAADAESLVLPAGFDALLRLFPLLDCLDPDHSAPRAPEARDAPAMRRRAMEALWELLEAVAGDRPMVLWFDDLQWGDVESAFLINELARCRGPQSAMIIVSYRPEPTDCVLVLGQGLEELNSEILDLAPLPEAAGAALLRSRVGDTSEGDERAVATLLEEAGGNPFLIEELARYISENRGAIDPDMTLPRMLRERLGALSEEARRVLSIVCVAGYPIAEPVVALAAGVNDGGRYVTQALLVDRRLRRVGADGREVVAYHDRMREEVLANLSEEALATAHARIAAAMQSLGHGEPESLLEHLRAAGQADKAAAYAVTSARRASSALAFERAARLYELALDLHGPENELRAELLFEYAGVLAAKGRGAEAAERYLEVAGCHTGDAAQECRRLAAEQFLRSGHMDEGKRLARDLLGDVGLSLPAAGVLGLLQIGWSRAWLHFRGLRHVPRSAEDVDPAQLRRIDTAHNIAISLGLTDILGGYGLHSRSVMAALQAGEPHRLARALAFDAAYTAASSGLRGRQRTEMLHRTASTIARGINDPYMDALLRITGATIAWSSGEWQTCTQRAREGIDLLLRESPGSVWEINFGRTHWLDGLAWSGRWAAMADAIPSLLADAIDRGDLGQEILLRTRYMSTAGLAANEPERSRAGLGAISRWTRDGFHVEHLVVAYQSTEIGLYEGECVAAWETCNSFWPDLRRSTLLRMQPWRILMHTLRARAASAAAADLDGRRRAQALAQARADVRYIRGENAPWADAQLDAVEANIAAVSGDRELALKRLREAVASATQAGMHMVAASARLALGRELGDADGSAIQAMAEQAMRAEGVVRPDYVQRALVPFRITRS